MPSLDEIRESIEARIAALRSEMSSLQAARAALHNNSGPRTQTRKAPGIRRTKEPTRSTSPEAASEEREPTDPAQATAADAPGAVSSERSTKRAATPRKPRARNVSSRTKPRTSAEVLLAGKLEAMLGESGEGLSVAAIVKRANARAGQVRELLRERESAGQVRRTGKGRSTRWRLVTDEERIAERVAELERLSIATR